MRRCSKFYSEVDKSYNFYEYYIHIRDVGHKLEYMIEGLEEDWGGFR